MIAVVIALMIMIIELLGSILKFLERSLGEVYTVFL